MAEHQQCKKSNGFQVRTKFSKCTYDFSWSIENCTIWSISTKLTSPEFHSVNNQVFYATLEIKYDSNYLANVTFLTFHRKSESGLMRIRHNASITDSCGKNFWKLSKDNTYTNSAQSCFFSFVTSTLTEYSNTTNDQILIFKCTMEIDKFSTDIGEKYIPSPSDNLSVLVSDLKSMYTSSLYADINLQVGDSVLRVHKSLLCARSPVFAKMFESRMKENENNAIAVPDIELPVMTNLLEFLYTGKLRAEDFESVYALYYAADKYDVSSLRQTCVRELLSKIDVKNACLVLSLANQHSDVQFKDAAMDFIQLHFDEIMETDAWEEFLEGETKLAADVMWMRCRSKKQKMMNDVK